MGVTSGALTLPAVHVALGGMARSRSSKPAQEVALTIRFPSDLMDRVDEEIKRIKAQHPGLPVTRAAAIRSLLTEALDAKEAKR